MSLVIKAFREKDAFSLTELMVVIVIVGILALLALPKFMSITTKAKMTEAKTMLKQIHTLQQGYVYEYDRFAADVTQLGFEQTKLVTEGGTARYIISIEEAGADGFIAHATSVVDFDRDGIFNVWMVDADGVILEHTPD